MFNSKLPTFLALGASVLGALAWSGAPALAQGKMMDDQMISDPAMMKSMMDKMDKMMAPMSQSEKQMMMGMMAMGAGERRVMMMTSPPAKNAGLQNATGFADVDVAGGRVEIVVTLPDGQSLPAGSVLEGWLSSAGRKGGSGPSTASNDDQKFGPAFGMAELSEGARDVPYALSTGLLRRIGNTQTYYGRFMIDNSLTPYAAVAVTVESDGNTGTYDPRPGSPLMAGMIAGGMMMGKDGKMMGADGKMMDGKMMSGDGMMMGDKMMGTRLMLQLPDGTLVPTQMYKGKLEASLPNRTLAEIKLMNGEMVAISNGAKTSQLVMVMADGTRRDVTVQDGKLLVAEPNGTLAEVVMAGK